ncbi:hypothetical protein Csp2054_08545 [Curtobacterium sp. 'Ferrero']|uniref:pentapeptide repeat-containing protein n=1 Tax=Curtobacterium sp. 'Ferrero' TaxID=2033654 RepID=UPI000BDC82BB|nr:pentapeptide repeat-containing protein [Curtobacterium sp. 'Ferrero']PCN48193.1 hypothetical protein Csp2054_08545 [Curtobacterium sp. 'Ferrero']
MTTTTTAGRERLRADCSSCAALCCTALGFQRSADFPVDKPAGTPCGNLDADFACTIHRSLRPRGFVGCTVFDCFGAGQHVITTLYGGRTWRDDPDSADEQFRVFGVTRRLYELLWYLAEAADRAVDPDTVDRVDALRSAVTAATASAAAALAADAEALHGAVRDVLVEVSLEARGGYAGRSTDVDPAVGPGADLAGRDLRGAPLCGADLRSAVLIAADLRGVDLTDTDLLGADLRNARLDGADLSRTLFTTSTQLAGAHGDHRTRLPTAVARPAHWR